ncbi:unnamed protein product [Ectocarpus sp. CCAP 1310/34]|nr:unnamed protein product [Ectocarpus sp. CCAP 1310/34]
MRCCGKSALVAAFGQALLKQSRWTNSFADNAAKMVPAIDTLSKCSFPQSKSTGAVARRARGRTACWAVATVGCSEEAFATGGAERVAELLAGESADEGAVFYNRVGAINRDLSVLMANVLAEERVRERLAGKKRKKRQIPPTSRPSSADGTLRSRASLVDDVTQGGTASKGWGVWLFAKGALGRLSRGCWGGGVERVSNNEDQQEAPREDEDGILILDAFAASGVRALRYLTEVPGVQRVVANDYDEAAINTIRQAAVQCGVGSKLEVHRGDALDTLYSARAGGLGTYDLIDVDPFGCAAGFLDASVQAVTDGGLLCVTSTDMPVLSGAQPEVAWARYGSVPTRSGYHHEMSLRILLHAINTAAGRHRRSVQPVLSVAIDHYVRVFVRVSRSPKAALAAAQESTSYVLQSESCPSFFLRPILSPKQQSPHKKTERSREARRLRESTDPSTALPAGALLASKEQEFERGTSGTGLGAGTPQSLPQGLGGVCPETGAGLMAGGPIWSGPLHDESWVARAIAIASEGEKSFGGDGADSRVAAPRPRLAARARAESLLRAVSRELLDVPLFYNLRDMFATLGLKKHPRREQVMGALEAAGYRTSGMHKEPLAVKTDAPDAAVWDVLRCWARDNPQPPPVREAGVAILRRGMQSIGDADFDARRAGPEGSRREGVARGGGGFLHAHNPEQDWGPLARHSVMARVDDEQDGVEETPVALTS